MATNSLHHPSDAVGRGLVGFPGSEILGVHAHIDDLGEWQAGDVLWFVVVKLIDGREIMLLKGTRAIERDTYPRESDDFLADHVEIINVTEGWK